MVLKGQQIESFVASQHAATKKQVICCRYWFARYRTYAPLDFDLLIKKYKLFSPRARMLNIIGVQR
jgi:hypothetical protein